MHLHGIIRTATLEEIPPDSGNIEMVLKIQGVGAGQPAHDHHPECHPAPG